MKSWTQMLHKMFDALAFTNAGNLGALQNMLQENTNPAKHGGGKAPDMRLCTSTLRIAERTEIIQLGRPHEPA
jgi:hypothetical protein